MSIEVKVERRELFDYRKKEFIDELVPTLTVKRAVKTRGTGAGRVKVGSHFVGAGSTFLMTYLGIFTGTPDIYFSLRAMGTRYPGEVKGTVDLIYFESKGGETRIGNIKEPVHALGPGTFEWYAGSLGSMKDAFVAFEGVEL